MEFTFTNEINLLDIIGVVGWAIGILVGASWLKRRYANRLESDPMRIFQSNITDLETIARMMENRETRYFAREHDDSEDALASAKIADVIADYRIREMIYNGWLISCRDANRRNSKPYLHVRPMPGLYVVDPRQLVSERATVKAADLDSPEISVLSGEFLSEVCGECPTYLICQATRPRPDRGRCMSCAPSHLDLETRRVAASQRSPSM